MDKRNFLEVGRYDTSTFHFFRVFWDTLVCIYICPFPNTCLGGKCPWRGNVLLKTGGGIVRVGIVSRGIILHSKVGPELRPNQCLGTLGVVKE